uniref:GILT-like protein F37H8.5 n=1 Tax=Parastrongyloides trichosuri TaxID=131310 RepID=A0A0N5A1E7_PARTI
MEASQNQEISNNLDVNTRVVTVNVYGEGLCPDTTNFFDYYFSRFVSEFENEDDVLISYIPFGKAHCKYACQNSNCSYSCISQHGDKEVKISALQNCVIDVYKNFNDYFDIVHCVQGKSSIDNAATNCFTKIDTNVANALIRCGQGSEGLRLLAGSENITKTNVPDLNFVPWVVINGERDSSAIFEGLEKTVCKELSTFRTVPAVCNSYLK